MKILVITSSFPRTDKDPSGRFILDISSTLQKNGYAIIVLAPSDSNSRQIDNWNGVIVHRFSYFYPQRLMKLTYGNGIYYNAKANFLTFFQIPFFFLFEVYWGYKIAKKEKISIIHSHWLIPQGLVSLLIRMIYPVNVVITVHGSDIRLLPKFISKFVLSRADAIISPHPELTGILHSMQIPGVHEIPNITDETLFNSEISDTGIREELNVVSKKVITFIARLNDFKDPITFIKSIPYVIASEKEVTFLVVGDGPLKSDIEILVKKLEITRYVRLLGNRNDVNRILKISTIFTALSPYENIWSLVIIEAMKMKVPCIITNAGTTEQILQDNFHAILVSPRREVTLANAIIDLLRNESKRDFLVKNASSLIEGQFSTYSIEKKYSDLFSKLMR